MAHDGLTWKTLALIPARGGSQRLPGKNLRELGGRSLLARAIDCARGCPRIDRVVVTTDDESIAAAAREAGAEVPFLRPAALATAEASSGDAIWHALDWLAEHEGYRPDALALLQPTSPLRTTAHLDAALTQFLAQDPPAGLISVSPARPASWLYVSGGDGRLRRLFDAAPAPEPSAGEKLVIPNGALYLAELTYLRTYGFLGPLTEPFLMASFESVDVDTADDWELARRLDLGR